MWELPTWEQIREAILNYIKQIDWWGLIRRGVDGLAGLIAEHLGVGGWVAQFLAATIVATIILGALSAAKQLIKAIVAVMWIVAIIALIVSL